MRSPRFTAAEKRLIAEFVAQDVDRAFAVERQFLAGEISREDYLWLCGQDQTAEDFPPEHSRSFNKFRNKFDRWLDARAA